MENSNFSSRYMENELYSRNCISALNRIGTRFSIILPTNLPALAFSLFFLVMYGEAKERAKSIAESLFDEILPMQKKCSEGRMNLANISNKSNGHHSSDLSKISCTQASVMEMQIVQPENLQEKQKNMKRKVSGEIQIMRVNNLKKKSASALLLDLLLKRYGVTELVDLAVEFKIHFGIETEEFADPRRKKRKSKKENTGCWHGKSIIGTWNKLWNPLVFHLVKTLGADVEFTDSDGHFPLLLAVQYADSITLIMLLKENGADLYGSM